MIRILPTAQRWRRWRAMSGAERWLVLHSLALLVKAHFALARIHWAHEREHPAAPGAGPAVVEGQRQRAHRVARMVAHAAAVCPLTVTCLHRSWVLRQLLLREGIPCSLRIGVRSDPAQSFGAHAWVECHGEPLHEGADLHRHFSAFSTAFVPAPAVPSDRHRTAA